MKRSLIFLGVFVCATTFLTGCATVFSDSEYEVQVCSSRNGDVVALKQGYMTIATQATPYNMRLKASRDFFSGESYILEYVHPGTGQKEIALYNATMDPWIIGSFIFGGFLGIIIDGASGAMYKLPDQFFICTDENQFTSPVKGVTVAPATPTTTSTTNTNVSTGNTGTE